MTQKQDLQMQRIKKKFSSIAADLEYQYKNNILAYRQKYYELSNALNELYKDVKKCQLSIIDENTSKCKANDTVHDTQRDTEQYGQNIQQYYEPLCLVQFFKQFSINASSFCIKFRSREKQIKQEMSKLFSMDATSHFLQALAKKNLENFDLSLKLQQLNKNLEFKILQLAIAQKTTKQYQTKFQSCENDFNTIVLSITDMLKDCQKTQTQLRQQNRLQKQVFQSHKIEFQRFKADFKYKPSSEQKANRVRQVLEKKFNDRQVLLLKQTEKIIENRYKNCINSSNPTQKQHLGLSSVSNKLPK